MRSQLQMWWRQAGWAEWVRVAGAVTLGGAVLLFLLLATSAPQGGFVAAELQLIRAMRRGGEPIGPFWVESAVRDLTALGSVMVLSVLVALILGYLCLQRRYRVAALLAAATGGGAVLNSLLKDTFARPRPEVELRLVEVSSSSFPSGHAMAASIFYLTAGALLARVARRRREKIYLFAMAALLTGLVGASRVYLGVHYPTDVLAGWAAGTAWALACWFVADGLARRGALRAKRGAQPGG